jgi:hypothetical protein
MDPAYEIQLNKQELAQLGTLTVILGQVDDLMVQAVAWLLNVDRQAANIIMGSSKIADNVEIWANIIRNRINDEDILWLIELAGKESAAVSAARNDFIHATFSHITQLADGFSIPIQIPVARRVRKTNLRPVSELPGIIDQAARLSCLVAHVGHLVTGNPASSSAWLQRLGPTLPRRLDTALARTAKVRRRRQKPSRR